MTNNILIREGRKEDAPFIAKMLQSALHEEGCLKLAGSQERLPLLDLVFRRLCASENSQYSYLNTLIAEDHDGRLAGALVSYDGALLQPLRRAFIAVANEVLAAGFSEENLDDETNPEEFYLDSLAVEPEFQGRGIASALIRAAIGRHSASRKPFGLLCAYGNDDAFRLYERLGFNFVDVVKFAGLEMRHMQFPGR